ncbi:MAG: hypothetical protein J0L93_00095 [Deltaproteobacteria bacterium]|nr:hypothetical protein [Deltaproteobacteria bacterium]
MRSINSIDFEIEPVNKYERFFNRLILNSRLGDGAGRLKTIDLISPNDLDTLIHESFHAYKANFIELKKDFSQLNTWMKNRAHIVYSKYSKEKSEMALEEAYAVFIGSILSTKMKFAKNILSSSSSQHCSQRLGYLERLWTSTWNAKTQGYYYRDGIGEYWADTAKGLWVLITEGRKAYADIQNSDGAIYMENELPKLDKEWIAARFLDGKVQVSFKETFKDELKKINCYEETR